MIILLQGEIPKKVKGKLKKPKEPVALCRHCRTVFTYTKKDTYEDSFADFRDNPGQRLIDCPLCETSMGADRFSDGY